MDLGWSPLALELWRRGAMRVCGRQRDGLVLGGSPFGAARASRLRVEILAVRRIVLRLSAVYVAGCAFRSALPMLDVQRICLDDTVLSRIVIGRGAATIAELAFVAQWRSYCAKRHEALRPS